MFRSDCSFVLGCRLLVLGCHQTRQKKRTASQNTKKPQVLPRVPHPNKSRAHREIQKVWKWVIRLATFSIESKFFQKCTKIIVTLHKRCILELPPKKLMQQQSGACVLFIRTNVINYKFSPLVFLDIRFDLQGDVKNGVVFSQRIVLCFEKANKTIFCYF